MSKENYKPDHYDEKSTWAVVAEIAKLLLLLIWKGVKALGWLLLKLLKLLLRWTAMGLLWIIDNTNKATKRIKRFWNDNDTQQKRRKIGLWFKNAGKTILRGVFLFFVLVFKGIVWLVKNTVNAVIHLKPTAIWLWNGLKRAVKAIGRWFANGWKRFTNWTKIKYRIVKDYKKDKNFKEMLFDMRKRLKGSINDYIEEDQAKDDNADETSEKGEEGDWVMSDMDFDDEDENANVFKKMGRSIYKAIKKLVEI